MNVVQRGKLAADKLGIERAHSRDRELLVGKDGDVGSIVVRDFYLLANDIEVLGSVLVHQAHLLDFLDIHDGTSVQDREFRAIDLYETVIDTHGIERGHTVLYRSYPHALALQDRTTLGIGDVVCDGIDDRLALHVDTLYLVTRILGCRIERHGEVQSRM